MKCSDESCNLDAFTHVTRGSEVIFYCRRHASAWMKIMEAM